MACAFEQAYRDLDVAGADTGEDRLHYRRDRRTKASLGGRASRRSSLSLASGAAALER
jgi:hypothetical protein